MICNIFIVAGESPASMNPVPLSSAIEQMLAAKRLAGRRARYLKGLMQYLRMFSRGRESEPIQAIGIDELEEWFTTRGELPATRASNVGRLGALFGYAVRRGWITDNPCLRIERGSIDRSPPKILSLHKTARALIHTLRHDRKFLAWLSLALLAGLRPEEADQMTWERIDFDSGTATVDGVTSKIRRRRIVHLTPAALAWLRLARNAGSVLPLKFITRRRFIRRLRVALRLYRWPQDLLRHTAASHLLAHVGDSGRVARELGNSPGILLNHYAELVSRERGARFASLVPSNRLLRWNHPAMLGSGRCGQVAP